MDEWWRVALLMHYEAGALFGPIIRGCLGLLCSHFFSYAPRTPPWSSSTIEFVEHVVLFGTQLCSSYAKWSIMPLIEIAFDIFQEK
jgi:hypothetical protein